MIININVKGAQDEHLCLYCGKKLSGNTNKKFCDDFCKNNYHNKKRKVENEEIGTIIGILKSNRRILQAVVGSGSVQTISEQRLLDKGFIFRYHTHVRPNKKDNKEYFFCFDYGYLPIENKWYKVVKAFK